MAKQLVIKVQADGSVRVETVGLSGDACLEYAEVAEDVCGAAIADQIRTAGYYTTVVPESLPAENDDLA